MSQRTYQSISSRTRRFLEPFLRDLSSGPARLVGELFQGMLASGRSLLSEIGRYICDGTTLPHREKRFSRGLDRPGWWQDAVRHRLLERGARGVRGHDLIAVDISDLSKPYARKLEHLDWVRDGSRKTLTPGYWLYEAWHIDRSGQPLPLQLFPYSTRDPQFISENQEWLSGLWDLMDALEGKGILMMDRGADRWKLMRELLRRPRWWIIRQRGDRHLIGPGGVRKRAGRWACELLEGRQLPQAIRVRLPRSPTPLWLVVSPARSKDEGPLMLLCRLPWTRSVVHRVLDAYRRRWRAEDAIRAIKQGLAIEKFLVRSMRRIERLVLVALLVMRFVAERLAREPRWAHGVLARDERFPRRIKVYLSPILHAIRRGLSPPRKIVWEPG